MLVGCIVLHFGDPARTVSCVESLYTQRGVRISVCIVNNAQRRSDEDLLRSAFPDAQVETPPQNLGFGAGCNYAVQALAQTCQPEFLLLINNDAALVADTSVAALCDALQRSNAALVGPRVRDGYTGQQVNTLLQPIPLTGKEALRLILDRWLGREEVSRNRSLSGVCWLLRRTTYEELNGFDEGFFMYIEDHDFCYRLGQSGGRVAVVRESEVVHYQDSVKVLVPSTKRFQWSYSNKMLYLVKHGGSGLVKVGLAGSLLWTALRELLKRRGNYELVTEIRAVWSCLGQITRIWRYRHRPNQRPV